MQEELPCEGRAAMDPHTHITGVGLTKTSPAPSLTTATA